ncbi:hypothetical protein PVAND_005248 [Polypedilum vanderplanki]|uniref:Large ribosomal subunit protein mL62 n=1 Tax=Polypedilum vanderplanki TaxID=319348 RepID=A0A9J6C007_POLVA|nr:hypothetical protein PVAND_005248 [Polypedilum vanderplanki]
MLKLTKLIVSNSGVRNIRILSASCYKSDISLETLYPNSKQNIFTPSPPSLSQEKFNGYIPIDQLQISYDRASGPGGQNVNKVATKVDLRFHVQSANWIPEKAKQQLIENNKMKINKEGFLIIKSDLTRYQQMNLADALEKLRNLIREAEKPKNVELSPETLEKIRKRQEIAANQRLIQKRQKSATKEGRKEPSLDL